MVGGFTNGAPGVGQGGEDVGKAKVRATGLGGGGLVQGGKSQMR